MERELTVSSMPALSSSHCLHFTCRSAQGGNGGGGGEDEEDGSDGEQRQ